MELGLEALPQAVRDGAGALFRDGVYFAPVRHHSPACAWALQALIREVRPAAILIEGADQFNALLPLLTDAATRPPVAILAQPYQAGAGAPAADADAAASMFFPLCDYSPEWVALREGQAVGAALAFIDRHWEDADENGDEDGDEDGQDADEGGGQGSGQGGDQDSAGEAGNLQDERYLAHSRWLAALAGAAGCRDHHELWDHWFELRPTVQMADWRRLFSDVFCWCAMARLDYEPAVLEAEGSLPRERHMAAAIRAWRAKTDGPLVVVTGGFHTMALLDWQHAAPAPAVPPQGGQWLVRYDFSRLDALNHYAAGMPSPHYYQQVWEALQAGVDNPWQSATQALLLELARGTRALGLAESLSTADVQAALLQAAGLAQLRGHAGPGRADLLDAIRSCYIKHAIGDGDGGLLADVRKLLAGSRIGDVPPSAGSPPLVEDARRRARAHGIALDDGVLRTSRLDVYRKPAHLARSRFFHLMSYLDTSLAQWRSGPDFATGTRLDMLFEEWRYGWSGMVEARLVALSHRGTSLQAVALGQLLAQEAALGEQGRARSASSAVQLLLRACQVGLHQRLPQLFHLIRQHLDEDASFASVVRCGEQLLALWQARERLGLQDHAALARLLGHCWSAAVALLPGLALSPAADEAAQIDTLRAMAAIGKRLAAPQLRACGADVGLLAAGLQRLLREPDCAPGVEAAAAALLYLAGAWDSQRLAGLLARRFGTGAASDHAVRFLNGLTQTAAELLLHEPVLLEAFNHMLERWDEADFIAFLPDLRHAFTRLNPRETDRLAEAVGQLNGTAAPPLWHGQQDVSATDLQQGVRLQQALLAALADDGLAAWLEAAPVPMAGGADGGGHG